MQEPMEGVEQRRGHHEDKQGFENEGYDIPKIH
jgi:hypothetical protein